MKKSLLALATLTAFAGAASAQSSVTLFGIIDVNARSQENGSTTVKSLSTDGINSSRLGLRGVEDLGGGLRAGFWLEGGLSADIGGGTAGGQASGYGGTASGQTWQRRSTVSLLGGFGEIRLGRDYTPTFWNHTVFDPFGTNGVGSQLNMMTQQTTTTAATATQAAIPGAGTVLGSGATTLVRSNNSIGYFLPSLGGVYGQLMVSAGENTTGNKYFGGRLGYGAGPINVAVSYGQTEQTGTMRDDFTEGNIAATYNFGFATLHGFYGESEYLNVKQKNGMLGVSVPFGANTLRASYNRVTGKTDQVALGYQYDLSKRSAIYAAASRIDNKSGQRFVTSNSGSVIGAGQKSTGYELGIRHSF